MKLVDVFSHRNGLDILQSPRFGPSFEEFKGVLARLPVFRSARTKKSSPEHVVAPGAMNQWLDNELCIVRDWDWHPLIIESDPTDTTRKSLLRSDFRKDRIEVEVQFGNVARYAYDVYKMAIAMALEHSDVGIMVVCMKRFAGITGGNIAYFERAVRELEQSRLTLIVPLVVIGIEPETWITDGFLPEHSAPRATAEMINAARRRRGEQPVVPDGEELESSWSVPKLEQLVKHLA